MEVGAVVLRDAGRGFRRHVELYPEDSQAGRDRPRVEAARVSGGARSRLAHKAVAHRVACLQRFSIRAGPAEGGVGQARRDSLQPAGQRVQILEAQPNGAVQVVLGCTRRATGGDGDVQLRGRGVQPQQGVDVHAAVYHLPLPWVLHKSQRVAEEREAFQRQVGVDVYVLQEGDVAILRRLLHAAHPSPHKLGSWIVKSQLTQPHQPSQQYLERH
mmetsp:Transcript_27331/g.70935  ORF Transcript_27331/g.70935 Transcript_27331/m.70935 type:complete len:215 (+) Transcript_27331:1343-1987(+)